VPSGRSRFPATRSSVTRSRARFARWFRRSFHITGFSGRSRASVSQITRAASVFQPMAFRWPGVEPPARRVPSFARVLELIGFRWSDSSSHADQCPAGRLVRCACRRLRFARLAVAVRWFPSAPVLSSAVWCSFGVRVPCVPVAFAGWHACHWSARLAFGMVQSYALCRRLFSSYRLR